jgi:hypothetical protein
MVNHIHVLMGSWPIPTVLSPYTNILFDHCYDDFWMLNLFDRLRLHGVVRVEFRSCNVTSLSSLELLKEWFGELTHLTVTLSDSFLECVPFFNGYSLTLNQVSDVPQFNGVRLNYLSINSSHYNDDTNAAIGCALNLKTLILLIDEMTVKQSLELLDKIPLSLTRIKTLNASAFNCLEFTEKLRGVISHSSLQKVYFEYRPLYHPLYQLCVMIQSQWYFSFSRLWTHNPYDLPCELWRMLFEKFLVYENLESDTDAESIIREDPEEEDPEEEELESEEEDPEEDTEFEEDIFLILQFSDN